MRPCHVEGWLHIWSPWKYFDIYFIGIWIPMNIRSCSMCGKIQKEVLRSCNP